MARVLAIYTASWMRAGQGLFDGLASGVVVQVLGSASVLREHGHAAVHHLRETADGAESMLSSPGTWIAWIEINSSDTRCRKESSAPTVRF